MQHVQGCMENFEKLSSLIKLCHSAKRLPYLFSQVFYWNECFFCPQHCFPLTQEGSSPLPLQYYLHPTLASPSIARAGFAQMRMRLSFQSFSHSDIFSPHPPPLILCENVKVICCLRWSAFWTPAVAVGLKQGPPSENNYFCECIGCVSCPSSETVIQKCNFLPDLPWQGLKMGSNLL